MTIKKIYSLYSKHYLVDTDSRSIRKNTLFFALKGDNFNGNKFANEALKKGASYSIIDEIQFANSENTILVDNVLECLQELAAYHRSLLNLPILALTGSNGKTTTKELISAVMSSIFKTVATKGNLNNHIGVPLTLLSMTPNTEFGIIEMGANHLKEIELLCAIAKPNFGYITNFGKAHIEGFGSMEGVIQGKSELYDFLRTSYGKVFINTNDGVQVKQSEGIHSIPFESSLKELDSKSFVQIKFNDLTIKSQLIGSYNYSNITAAITIGMYFNIDPSDVKKAIENYTPNDNRSQIITKGSSKIILDAYNANPSSMEVAIQNFQSFEGSSKVLILGDMFELGSISEFEHQNIVDIVERINLDSIYLIGKSFFITKTKKALKYERFEDFKENFTPSILENSSILIKGSRGMALERILDLF